jgi:hypothetical protein
MLHSPTVRTARLPEVKRRPAAVSTAGTAGAGIVAPPARIESRVFATHVLCEQENGSTLPARASPTTRLPAAPATGRRKPFCRAAARDSAPEAPIAPADKQERKRTGISWRRSDGDGWSSNAGRMHHDLRGGTRSCLARPRQPQRPRPRPKRSIATCGQNVPRKRLWEAEFHLAPPGSKDTRFPHEPRL